MAKDAASKAREKRPAKRGAVMAPVVVASRPKPQRHAVPPAGSDERSEESLAPFADLLLPYQVRYLRDRSQLKKLVKSRRIGGTWMQSLEDVLDCIDRPGLKVWFSSADRTAAAEYLDYVKMWVDVANLLVQTIVVSEDDLGTGEGVPEAIEVADPSETTATVLLFHNGSKITSLSSNPSGFRSKGGKVVLDEFAHHKSDRDLWKAAQPVAGAWGYDIRILSTQNGKGCTFYRLGNPEYQNPVDDEDVDGESGAVTGGWSVHTITIDQAVEEGMYDRVKGRPTTPMERARYIRGLRRQCLSDDQFEEEFRCIACDEAHALITYDMISAVERPGLLGLDLVEGPLYIGMDIARKRDLSVIYAVEVVGRTLVTRSRIEMVKTAFSRQREVLFDLLRHPKMVRASIDATGIGAMLAEGAQEHFGTYRVEAVSFSNSIKDALATRLVQEFQDATVLLQPDKLQREGIHAVRKITTATGGVRYDAEHDEQTGHGDHFWALALAVSAARSGAGGVPRVTVERRRRSGTSRSSLDSWAGMQ